MIPTDIEFHDALVQDIRFRADSVAVLFSHLYGRVTLPDRSRQGWSFSAELRCENSARACFNGVISPRFEVVDDEVMGMEAAINATQLLKPTPIAGLRLAFDNGASFEVVGGTAMILFLNEGEFVEMVKGDDRDQENQGAT